MRCSVSKNSGKDTEAASAPSMRAKARRRPGRRLKMPWRCGGRRMNRAPRHGSAGRRALENHLRMNLDLQAHAPEIFGDGAMRSVSFTRSSEASRTDQAIFACRPQYRQTPGSRRSAPPSALSRAPRRERERLLIKTSPISSPPACFTSRTLMDAPFRTGNRAMPTRVGFRPTP